MALIILALALFDGLAARDFALHGKELGDGLVLRTCREVRRKCWTPPVEGHHGRAVVSASPQTGISLRDISAELAARGHSTSAGCRSLQRRLIDARKVAMVAFVSQKSLT
jgi:hypothetical protein